MAKFTIFALLALSVAAVAVAGPSPRCKYPASSMTGFQPEKWAGVWYADSSTDNSLASNLLCEVWNTSLIEPTCNNPTGGCSQAFAWVLNEKVSPSFQLIPGWFDQTAGKTVGSYYGAYYDMYSTQSWYTIDVQVLDTDYTTYAALYICERDNMQEANPDQIFLHARKQEGLGNDVRNQIFQKLTAKFNWNFNNTLNVYNNSNCSFPMNLH